MSLSCNSIDNKSLSNQIDKQLKAKDLIGNWNAVFDISNFDADDITIGFLSSGKYVYSFAIDNTGEREAEIMGMSVNSPLSWQIKMDTIFLEYKLFEELVNEKLIKVEDNKLQIIDEQDVITYLVKEEN